MSTDSKIDDALANWQLDLLRQAKSLVLRCESPIEALFLARLLEWGDWHLPDQQAFVASRSVRGLSFKRYPMNRWAVLTMDGAISLLFMQPEIAGKRVDFAAVDAEAGGFRVAIELDGHDFHERTKEQVARDRSRDRDLSARGWRVARWTGSELHRLSAGELSHQLYELIFGKLPALKGAP